MQHKKIVLTTGLALFAMFFGAGNIIYPLALGVHSGRNFIWVLFAFLLSGVGLPFLGLFSTSLYQGNYWDFFQRLGKIPSLLIVGFLILILGPLFATPRTAIVTYHTLSTYLPNDLNHAYVLSFIYCALIFLLTYKRNNVVDIIGKFLSPIKISSFFLLVVIGIFSHHATLPSLTSVTSAFEEGFINGYGTMDLLAAFFFCSLAFQNILSKSQQLKITDKKIIHQLFLKSCVTGGLLLALVYTGFMLAAYYHAANLQSIETPQMIAAISNIVLGSWGGLFVCICVTFACVATATALTEIATQFSHERIFLKKIPRIYSLIMINCVTYFMSILGFSAIMRVALPILEILYPLLIVYSIINLLLSFSLKPNVKPIVTE